MHPNDMSKEDLLKLLHAMTSYALDLAQHLHFTVTALKPEYKEEAYIKAVSMAYHLSYDPFNGGLMRDDGDFQVYYFGEKGLETTIRPLKESIGRVTSDGETKEATS